jgi:hypothetical protein
VAAAKAPRKRSRFASFMRGLLAILLIAIVAGVIAAVILLATDAGQQTDVGKFIGDNVDQSLESLKQFIIDNTQ